MRSISPVGRLLYLSTVGIIPEIQSKPLSHPIERAPVNAENLRGSDFVSLGFLQNADEVTFLNLLKRQTSFVARANRLCCFFRQVFRPTHLCRQVIRREEGAVT